MGKTTIGDVLRFNFCEVDVGSEVIDLSMWAYLEKLSPVELTRVKRRKKDERSTETEETEYRALEGTLMYINNSVIPQAALVTSRIQQRLGDLRVSHIMEIGHAHSVN